MIKSVIRLKNNMVLVFDVEDEEIPEYQGQREGKDPEGRSSMHSIYSVDRSC